jgi:hypothetical protein
MISAATNKAEAAMAKIGHHRLAQEREYASRSLGPSPAAAASSRHLVIRSLKEGRGAGA